ncbi:hypothetical protein ACJX0J_022356, partial [Zea mays]
MAVAASGVDRRTLKIILMLFLHSIFLSFFSCVLIEYECAYMKDYKLLSTTTFEGPIGRPLAKPSPQHFLNGVKMDNLPHEVISPFTYPLLMPPPPPLCLNGLKCCPETKEHESEGNQIEESTKSSFIWDELITTIDLYLWI